MHILLFVTGVLNAAFVAFHVFFGLQIAGWTGLPATMIGLIQTYNASCGLMPVFLAIALLVRGKEVMGTGLGAATLALGTALYFSRAILEFVWLGGSARIAAVYAVMGLLHAILFFGVRVTRPVT